MNESAAKAVPKGNEYEAHWLAGLAETIPLFANR